MKYLILAVFVVAAAAAPLDDNNGPVELIVNGLPEGQPLEISHIVDIKLQEHNDGAVVATNLLHPLTAEGIAEAEIAANPVQIPEPVVLPAPAQPEITEVMPEAVVLPAPAQPELIVIAPEAVVLPVPAQPEMVLTPEAVFLPALVQPELGLSIPAPVILSSPAVPEVVIPEALVLPEVSTPEVVEAVPAPLSTGEIFNDGNVQVQVNVNSQETGYLSTIQSWFSMVVNYFNDGVQNSQQIV